MQCGEAQLVRRARIPAGGDQHIHDSGVGAVRRSPMQRGDALLISGIGVRASRQAPVDFAGIRVLEEFWFIPVGTIRLRNRGDLGARLQQACGCNAGNRPEFFQACSQEWIHSQVILCGLALPRPPALVPGLRSRGLLVLRGAAREVEVGDYAQVGFGGHADGFG